jgi:alpha-L-rhamnosidase
LVREAFCRPLAGIGLTVRYSSHRLPGGGFHFHHYPADPIREKVAWTQDAQDILDMSLLNFDMATLYRKWYYDLLDEQDAMGYVPAFDPLGNGFRAAPDSTPPLYTDTWWSGAVIYLPYNWYLHTGDARLIQDGYPAMKRFFSYVTSTAKDNLTAWALGDWLEVGAGTVGFPIRTPHTQTSSSGYFYLAKTLSRCAAVLGYFGDASTYDQMAEQIRSSFNAAFLDPSTGIYAADSQTSQVLPLYLGVAPDDSRQIILDRLLDNLAAQDFHLSTGFVGTLPLLMGLTDSGNADLAYRVVQQPDHPGWLFMLEEGGRTFWESWEGNNGKNFLVLGGPPGMWFYEALAGIRPDPAGPGFKNFVIKPEVAGDLQWVTAHHDSLFGRIVSNWTREGKILTMRISVPVNSTAQIYIPANATDAVTENEVSIDGAPGLEVIGYENGRVLIVAQSGTYVFRSILP